MPVVCPLSPLVFRQRLLPVTVGGECLWQRKSRQGCRRLQAPKKLFDEDQQTSSAFHVWVTHGGPCRRAGSQFVKRLDHPPFGIHGSKPHGPGQGQHHRVRGWTRAIEGGGLVPGRHVLDALPYLFCLAKTSALPIREATLRKYTRFRRFGYRKAWQTCCIAI